MRSYILGAGIAVASLALDVEETLKDKVFNRKQGGSPKDDESFVWTGDFTQANCQTDAPYHVDELPGFLSFDTWPCSYAGTLPGLVDIYAGTNLFFWIYPAEEADAPVTIWLNGGPGTSS